MDNVGQCFKRTSGLIGFWCLVGAPYTLFALKSRLPRDFTRSPLAFLAIIVISYMILLGALTAWRRISLKAMNPDLSREPSAMETQLLTLACGVSDELGFWGKPKRVVITDAHACLQHIYTDHTGQNFTLEIGSSCIETWSHEALIGRIAECLIDRRGHARRDWDTLRLSVRSLCSRRPAGFSPQKFSAYAFLLTDAADARKRNRRSDAWLTHRGYGGYVAAYVRTLQDESTNLLSHTDSHEERLLRLESVKQIAVEKREAILTPRDPDAEEMQRWIEKCSPILVRPSKADMEA